MRRRVQGVPEQVVVWCAADRNRSGRRRCYEQALQTGVRHVGESELWRGLYDVLQKAEAVVPVNAGAAEAIKVVG